MSDRLAAHLPPAIRNLPARTRRLTIGAAVAITIGAAVAIPALLAAGARPGIAVFTGHTGTIYSVAFSPDGKTLASASRDGTVRLWDVATHRQIGNPIAGHAGGVTSVAFSPDGKTLATGRLSRSHGAAVGRRHPPPDRQPHRRAHRYGLFGGVQPGRQDRGQRQLS